MVNDRLIMALTSTIRPDRYSTQYSITKYNAVNIYINVQAQLPAMYMYAGAGVYPQIHPHPGRV